MTSEKAMLSRMPDPAGCLTIGLLTIVCAMVVGCGPRIDEPAVYASPYPAPKLWAVMPFRNESGTTIPDGVRLADKLTQRLQQIDGIDVLPVNRVIEAANATEIGPIDSVGEAISLMQALDVDGLIVGSISAWDPYEPPKIGATIQLYSRRNPGNSSAVDTRSLTYAATDQELPGTTRFDQPVATAGGYFDAANGGVLKRLTAYAEGRSGYESPSGWRAYLINMDLYSEFVSHELMRRLFKAEWERLTAERQATPLTQPPDKQ